MGRSGVTRAAATAPEPVAEETGQGPVHLARGLRLTRRALVFLVVAAVMLLSYASSLRVYFRQQSQIAQTQAQISQRQQSITDLQQQVARWNDPNYVKAQARTRLGWVMPGEIGYQVIGSDGTVLSPSVSIDGTGAASTTQQTSWWQRLVGSLGTADNPTTVASSSATPTTITPTTTPSASTSGSATATATSTPTR